jgi:hypothetical protein
MKVHLSLLLTSALLFGAATLAFGDTSKSSSSGHKSRSSTHHHSSGSKHSTNSGSKTHSNVPSNPN